MAVAGHLSKIVWGGTLAGSESWSCGLHFISPDAAPLDDNLVAQAVGQWFTRLTSNISSLAKLEWCKVNKIDPTTGLYVDAANPRTVFIDPVVSGGSSPNFPHLSVCVSTYTAAARGRASKGRFYPPTSGGLSLGTDGKIVEAVALEMSASAAQLITDLNGTNTGECVVFSKIGQSILEISGCRVGRVADTQQRRRRNLTEDYQSTPVS